MSIQDTMKKNPLHKELYDKGMAAIQDNFTRGVVPGHEIDAGELPMEKALAAIFPNAKIAIKPHVDEKIKQNLASNITAEKEEAMGGNKRSK